MGNRAAITAHVGASAPGIYLHWNGGIESVLAFLEAAKQLGVRDASDPDYMMGRLGQVIANYFSGTLSFGFGVAKQMDYSDNGIYVIGEKFKITKRLESRDKRKTLAQLSPEEREKYEAILKQVLEINRPIFERKPD